MPNLVDNLKWQKQMGVSETIEEKTQNRFEEAKTNKQEQPSIKAIDSKNTIKPPSSLISSTQKNADNCKNLDELKQLVTNFKELSIARTATNTVFADGNPKSNIMLVGEAPGAEEDAQGIPFCGASGKLLDQMLACIDLYREKNCYISNTIFWRPPGNRRPTPEELATCAPFVTKHIGFIQPELIILVGGTAVTSLLGAKDGITKMRGKFFDYTNPYLNKTIKTTAIFHPSYLLRSPGQKRVAWKDLLSLREYIDENIEVEF